jgi:hypothetical protein
MVGVSRFDTIAVRIQKFRSKAKPLSDREPVDNQTMQWAFLAVLCGALAYGAPVKVVLGDQHGLWPRSDGTLKFWGKADGLQNQSSLKGVAKAKRTDTTYSPFFSSCELWKLGAPRFSGKARLTQRACPGNSLNAKLSYPAVIASHREAADAWTAAKRLHGVGAATAVEDAATVTGTDLSRPLLRK